jgi:membrane-bound lytic murein transglycosylase F
MVDSDGSLSPAPHGDGRPVPVLRLALALVGVGILGTCSTRPAALEQARLLGELRVATRNGASAYYLGPNGAEGPEFDLASRFAATLGLPVRFELFESRAAVVAAVANGRAHLGAAGLAVLPDGSEHIRFSTPYQMVPLYVIYHRDGERPVRLEDLAMRRLAVVAGSAGAVALAATTTRLRRVPFTALEGVDVRELLERVASGTLDATIADANEFLLSRTSHPELRAAFSLGTLEELAWALPRGDPSLATTADAFLSSMRPELPELMARYYARPAPFESDRDTDFVRHVQERLPALRGYFERTAIEFDEDWRVLAAIGYQESKWDAAAVSPTGVRGIMMLTAETAAALGVKDRADAAASIRGGARYLDQIRDSIPDRVAEPDRTWFALAAYNIGYGHLEDARILAEANGKDAASWQDVRPYLALLSQERYYTRAKRGYARGWEAAHFVDLVQAYVDRLHILIPDPPGLPTPATAGESTAARGVRAPPT